MERLLKTTLVSGQAWHTTVTEGEILFDFPHAIFLNTCLVSFWMDRRETSGIHPRSRSPSRQGRWVLWSCLVFIYGAAARGRAHYSLRHRNGHCAGECWAGSPDPCSSLCSSLRSEHLSSEQHNNTLEDVPTLMMILNTAPLAATKRTYKSWTNQVSSHFEAFAILLSSSAHK